MDVAGGRTEHAFTYDYQRCFFKKIKMDVHMSWRLRRALTMINPTSASTHTLTAGTVLTDMPVKRT
jgi:hypothetical protein